MTAATTPINTHAHRTPERTQPKLAQQNYGETLPLVAVVLVTPLKSGA